MEDKKKHIIECAVFASDICSIHFSLYFYPPPMSIYVYVCVYVHALCLRLQIFSSINAADLIEISKNRRKKHKNRRGVPLLLFIYCSRFLNSITLNRVAVFIQSLHKIIYETNRFEQFKRVKYYLFA